MSTETKPARAGAAGEARAVRGGGGTCGPRQMLLAMNEDEMSIRDGWLRDRHGNEVETLDSLLSGMCDNHRRGIGMPRKLPEEIVQRWNDAATKTLVGRTIVAARYMDADEAAQSDWGRRAVVLVLDNGALVFPQSDDEGNDAGALYVQGKDDGILLPTL
jgi:hypothetical protein